MRTAVACLSFLAGVSCVAMACTGEDVRGPNGASGGTSGTTGTSGGSVLGLAMKDVAPIVVQKGSNVIVPIELERPSSTPVDIVLDPVPTGVAATPLTLSPNQSTGTITVTATDAAAQSRTRVQLIARTTDATASKEVGLVVRGRAGDRDATYGEAGSSIATVLPLYELAEIAIDPEDRVVVAGRRENVMSHGECAVTRATTDGKVDLSFGDADGVANLEERVGHCRRLHILADGSILVAGHPVASSPSDVVPAKVARLDAAGKLDAAFGEQGVATVRPPGSDDYEVVGLSADSAGRILVAVSTSGGARVRRVSGAGLVDAIAAYDVGTGGFSFPGHMLVGPSDVPILVGSVSEAGKSRPGVAFLDGPAAVAKPLGQQWLGLAANGVAIDAKMNVVIASVGTGFDENTYGVISRATKEGVKDASFNAGIGEVTELLGAKPEQTYFSTVIEQTDGKLVVVGGHAEPTGSLPFVIRYDASGARDASLGTGGLFVDTSVGGYVQGAVAEKRQATVIVGRRGSGEQTRSELLRFWL